MTMTSEKQELITKLNKFLDADIDWSKMSLGELTKVKVSLNNADRMLKLYSSLSGGSTPEARKDGGEQSHRQVDGDSDEIDGMVGEVVDDWMRERPILTFIRKRARKVFDF